MKVKTMLRLSFIEEKGVVILKLTQDLRVGFFVLIVQDMYPGCLLKGILNFD